MPSPYGVIVVGSGPAGATAARYGARRGLKVLLVDKRKEIGVPVQCGEYVAHNADVETNHGTFHGKVIIGSDGPRSTVAKSVGLEWPVSAPAMSATADGEFSDATDMFFGNLAPGGYAWIIPKAGCANVGLGTWERFRGNLRELFNKFVTSRSLEPGKATGGFVPVLGPPPRTVKGNVMLVGDAAGMVMATNGGGNNV